MTMNFGAESGRNGAEDLVSAPFSFSVAAGAPTREPTVCRDMEARAGSLSPPTARISPPAAPINALVALRYSRTTNGEF